jgi:ABC-2 type transport system ATP-binding protein
MIGFAAAGKTYSTLLGRRKVVALDDLSLDLRLGEVVGIAGPNGAGKSTLISLLLGFLNPSSGRVTIEGLSARRFVETRGVGYLTELVNLPPRWRVTDLLHRMAVLSGVPVAEVGSRVEAAIADLGLEEHRTKQVRQLSKGNLQRVGLAQALLGDFDVVVLDEPTHGLDPVWTARFRDVVARLRRPDRLVLIASHNLDELERLADRVAILNRGRLTRVVDSASHSGEEQSIAWRLILEGSPDVASRLPGATPVEGRAGTWRAMATRTDLSAALGHLLTAGAILVECVPEESRLAAEFREAVDE